MTNLKGKKLRNRALKLLKVLEEEYNSPNHNNKKKGIDELVFIILSLMTTQPSFDRVFSRLKQRLGKWDNLRSIPLSKLKYWIKDAGLSNQKAPKLKIIANKLYKDFGRVTLSPLKNWSNKKAEEYLISLPGIGKKAAKCILMYSFHRKLLPVDTHVLRVSKRLALLRMDSNSEDAHIALEKIIHSSKRYSYHVNVLAHGRTLCLAIHPKCDKCPLNHFCDFPKK